MVGRWPRAREEDGPRDTIGNTDERDDIARVVLEDRGDDRRVTVTEVIEVRIRNERAGDIGGPRVVEDAVFELFQRRRAEPVAPETPRGVEQVKMRFVDGELAAERHDEARSQERKVEALAVV